MKLARDFNFKRFTVSQDKATHKVGTDGVLLGTWVNVNNAMRILDIGTGTGVIALILAQRTSADTQIDALEIQREDFEQATINFTRSPWHDRIRIVHVSVQEFNLDKKYDLVVSNPPFFSKSWLPPAERRKVVRHSETLSFEDLADAAKRMLHDDGRFALILPVTEGRHFETLAKAVGLHCIRLCEFQTRAHKPVERLLMEFSSQHKGLRREKILLYSQGERWSDDYWQLTEDFYLERKG